MDVVVYVEKKREDFPGHLVVGQEGPTELPRYYGYYFDAEDVPEGSYKDETWVKYLMEHAVDGVIIDHTEYTETLLSTRRAGDDFLTARSPCSRPLKDVLPPEEEWEGNFAYSFNPDDFDTPERRCYNCVTWGTEVANRLVPGFLPRVRQGRIKLILQALQPAEQIGG